MKNIKNLIYILLICINFFSQNAYSDENDKKFSAFLVDNMEKNNQVFVQYTENTNEMLQEKCSEPYTIPAQITILEPIIFSKNNKYPHKGKWLYRYSLNRCGNKRTYNLVAEANNGIFPKHTARMMGESIASPILAQDVYSGLFIKVGSAHQELCKNTDELANNLVVFDTKLLTYKEDLSNWEELWSYKACGIKSSAKIKFTADGNGGTYYSILD